MSSVYQNTIIYKIICKDEKIKDEYVGHTTNWYNRKNRHKKVSETETSKFYQTIRENGGWENWEMIELEKYPCNNEDEARTRERYWYEILNAKLNTYCPILTQQEILNQRQIRNTIYRDNHLEEHKKYMKEYYAIKVENDPTYCSKQYQKYKEQMLKNKKEYYVKKIDENPDFNKQRYEKYKKSKLAKYTCECGTITTKNGKSSHEKTKKHKNYLNTICDEE
jgi:hypothetical protein